MKRTHTRLVALGVGAGLIALTACGSDANDSAVTEAPAVSAAADEMADDEMAEEADTIVDVAVENGSFTTLVAGVTAADLVDTLSSEGPFTVFAPTDDAFAALPDGLLDALLLEENKDVLTQILTYHVVPGTAVSTDLASGDVATVEGSNVAVVVESGVTVDGATVVAADVMASNGVIHVIDAVLVPPTIDVGALLG